MKTEVFAHALSMNLRHCTVEVLANPFGFGSRFIVWPNQELCPALHLTLDVDLADRFIHSDAAVQATVNHLVNEIKKGLRNLGRDGAAAARQPHKLEAEGSSPSPASKEVA